MRILHLLAPAKAGGLETVVQTIAVGQRARDNDVAVGLVVDEAIDHPLVDRLESGGVEVTKIVVTGKQYRRERKAVLDLCRRFRPEVVHTHGYRSDVIDAPAARNLGAATVSTVHGFTGGGWRNRLYEHLQERAFRRFDAVIAVSRPLGARLLRAGVPHESVHIVQNGLNGNTTLLSRADARSRLSLPPDAFVAGWIGRLSDEKGPDVALDAWEITSNGAARLAFVGEGPLRSGLEARAASPALGGRVSWHGLVPEASRLVRAFDVLIISSRTEGTPMVLLEAMAAGVPVVATAVGGIPDVVGTTEALLVESESPREIAAAVQSVLDDPESARHRAARATERVRMEFDYDRWLDRHETVYAAALTHATRTRTPG